MSRMIICFLLFACNFANAQLPDGEWHAAISLNDTTDLPFTFTANSNKIIIHNADEKIVVDDIVIKQDSVFIRMPVFDSEFRCKISGDELQGYFLNHARKADNVFRFHAMHGLAYRFSDKPERTNENISGRFHTVFDGEDDFSKDAVGIFKQEGNRVTGTFLTVTGDYRYLDGEMNGNRLWLSAFDGSHLFLFTAIVKGDSITNGEYFSGKHWHDTWRGKKDSSAHLPDADKLSAFSDSSGKFNFTFPDENGKLISVNDNKFKNKPVIVQIMGTWCPNCMDETKFLAEWYNNQKEKSTEIIALDYERIADSTTANRNIRKLKSRFNINYTILFAGSSDSKKAIAENLKLSQLLAYPTLIFLNKDKRVVKIHTGFNGPATGDEFVKFQKWFIKIEESLRE